MINLQRWQWLGRVPYADALAAQHSLRERVLSGDFAAQTVLLLEHPPVITLGRHASENHLLTSRERLSAKGVEVHRIERGGEVTYHGPGQLMIYAIVRVQPSVVRFLETVATVLAELCHELGLQSAEWRKEPAGVWIGTNKVAACGLHLRRGVAIHGFALNVSTPRESWNDIVACGLSSFGVTSLVDAAGPSASIPSLAELANRLGPRLVSALGLTSSASAPTPPA